MQEGRVVRTLGSGRDETRVVREEAAETINVTGDDSVGGGFETRVLGIVALEGPDLAGELGPAFESVGSRDEELRFCQLRGQFGLKSVLDARDFFALGEFAKRWC